MQDNSCTNSKRRIIFDVDESISNNETTDDRTNRKIARVDHQFVTAIECEVQRQLIVRQPMLSDDCLFTCIYNALPTDQQKEAFASRASCQFHKIAIEGRLKANKDIDARGYSIMDIVHYLKYLIRESNVKSYYVRSLNLGNHQLYKLFQPDFCRLDHIYILIGFVYSDKSYHTKLMHRLSRKQAELDPACPINVNQTLARLYHLECKKAVDYPDELCTAHAIALRRLNQSTICIYDTLFPEVRNCDSMIVLAEHILDIFSAYVFRIEL